MQTLARRSLIAAIAACLFAALLAATAHAQTSIITTVAGGGEQLGDDGVAIGANLNSPGGVALDASGNLYIADTWNHRIRKVAAGTGIITTVAGNGGIAAANPRGTPFIPFFGMAFFNGDGVTATSTSLNQPNGVAVDASGNLYIADTGTNRIRKVAADTGIITTVAGNGLADFSSEGGAATSATLYRPNAVALDASGNFYIADSLDHRIRKVEAATGTITTVAGNYLWWWAGAVGFSGDGGAATNAGLNNPAGVALDANGNLYIADADNNRIRKVAAGTGIITTVAGNGTRGFSGDGGAATSASLSYPTGVALDASGNLYIADKSNARIRKLAANTGIITTVAGNGTRGFSGDGSAATSASLNGPTGVALDTSGNLYIADTFNGRIRKVSASTQLYQGAWWAGAADNGWGVSVIQHGDTLVSGWYYYDASGRATWTIMPGCTWNIVFTRCSGTLYNATGSWFGNYNVAALAQNAVGTLVFTFTDANNGSMSYVVNGVSGQKTLRRNFGSAAAPNATSYTDVWWGGEGQSGWGLTLVQQQQTLAAAWYTYDTQGRPTWLLMDGGTWTSATTYRSQLIRATGAPMIGAPYNAAAFTSTPAGPITLTFSDANTATMTYTVDGVTQTKTISRMQF